MKYPSRSAPLHHYTAVRLGRYNQPEVDVTRSRHMSYSWLEVLVILCSLDVNTCLDMDVSTPKCNRLHWSEWGYSHIHLSLVWVMIHLSLVWVRTHYQTPVTGLSEHTTVTGLGEDTPVTGLSEDTPVTGLSEDTLLNTCHWSEWGHTCH